MDYKVNEWGVWAAAQENFFTAIPRKSFYISSYYGFSTDESSRLLRRWMNRADDGGPRWENGIYPRFLPPLYPYDSKRKIFKSEGRKRFSDPHA